MMARVFFTLLFIIFWPQAWAQFTPEMPPVWPAQTGSVGSAFKYVSTANAKAIAWQHTSNGITTIYPICWLNDYEVIHPVTTGMTPIRTARAYWTANVTTVCERDPRMAEVFQAIVDEMWK